jgi:hypothetical protein
MNEELLKASLCVSVPLWIDWLKRRPLQEVIDRAPLLAEAVASGSDNVLFKSKKLGESGRAFNALAEGLATLAFLPGGVKLFGQHWEAVHPELGGEAPDSGPVVGW